MAYAAPQSPQPPPGEGNGLHRSAAVSGFEPAGARPRVLVVDDDAALAEMLGIIGDSEDLGLPDDRDGRNEWDEEDDDDNAGEEWKA